MRDLSKELNWDVKKSNLALAAEDIMPGVMVIGNPLADFKAIQRTDNEDVLSVQKNSYKVFNNSQLIDTAQKIADASHGEIVGFNEFKGGKKVLAIVQSGNNQSQIGGNTIEDYIVIGNSHDGSSGVFIGTSTTLIRCENQFSQIQKEFSIRHTQSMNLKVDEAVEMYRTYYAARDIMYQEFDAMRHIKLSNLDITAMTDKLFDVVPNEEGELSTRKKNTLEQFDNSIIREMNDLGQNMWGYFNAVTHYSTHVRGSEASRNNNNSFGNVIGSNANFNKKALGIIRNQVAELA